MTELEKETITALKTLFDKVDELQKINIRDILKPEIYIRYEKTLQEAYDALTQIERTINSLGMKLEYQHWRLGEAMDELKPFPKQTHI
ncbi:MAG TPA: hypothetical protein VEP90_19305 [Methylomirabilota bacterium]|nr:hypothetical protein [Methylomirabilota bacterium]